jgi:hypothetical protein
MTGQQRVAEFSARDWMARTLSAKEDVEGILRLVGIKVRYGDSFVGHVRT